MGARKQYFHFSFSLLQSESDHHSPPSSSGIVTVDYFDFLVRLSMTLSFTHDLVSLAYELRHYKHDVMMLQEFRVSTLVELSQLLSESGRSVVYVMLTRLIHLVLTLPDSTATTERAFSAMKHVKTALRNKMGMICLKIH
ncbi:hypothetical protein C2S52_006628 [Perilla frutescens var. hirtella]|nr:hypothetical protein C2S52_006628 [Perilla frutescens var. hirtella]